MAKIFSNATTMALIAAVKEKSLYCVLTLIAHGSEPISAVDSEGLTALDHAERLHLEDIACALRAASMSPTTRPPLPDASADRSKKER